ncbi:hypothetical protein [Pararobbsia silviterrae]|uniref:Uncharacterized protein n=1 Tax=Pararobbsia silviterrae TaxID=1792498 RepID=A0A494XV76_9BURK|nr:hypothetical protein [Pararobbsia silviterrae]RKP54521.1 hypothetical protein D7S86_12595 [Pararobbsia silviterrae]
MQADAKILKLVVTLNRLTSLGTLKWAVAEPPWRLTTGADVTVPLYLEVHHKGQRYALYQERRRRYDGDRDQFYGVEDLVLVVIDLDGHVLLEVREPYSALDDLFKRARAGLVDLDSILNDLGDPDGE